MPKQKWLLLVEDDRDIQDSLLDLLSFEGYQVRGAFDGEQALTVLRDAAEPPSLILLDLLMHGMGGQEFLEHYVGDTELTNAPVVIMSADGTAKSELVQKNAAGFLRKPADIEQILEVVQRYLGPPLEA